MTSRKSEEDKQKADGLCEYLGTIRFPGTFWPILSNIRSDMWSHSSSTTDRRRHRSLKTPAGDENSESKMRTDVAHEKSIIDVDVDSKESSINVDGKRKESNLNTNDVLMKTLSLTKLILLNPLIDFRELKKDLAKSHDGNISR